MSVDFHPLDVTDLDSIHRLKENIVNEYGRLDILVNNAGVYNDDQSSALRMKIDVFPTTMATNLHGSIKLCQAFIPLM
ncbi:SDR family NAD(P)-dependent oxidoreductase [Chloroflexota bacterium]